MWMGIAAGVGALADIGEGIFQAKAASSQEDAIQLQGKEQQISFAQQKIKNYMGLEKTTDAAIAAGSASGFASNSASFNAIQRNVSNNYAINSQNLNTESTIAQENTDIETNNVRQQLTGSIFSDTGQLASSLFMAARFMPSGG